MPLRLGPRRERSDEKVQITHPPIPRPTRVALSYIWHSPFSRYMPDIFLAYFGGLLLAGGGRLHADWLEGQLELGGWMTSPPGRGGRARARGGVGTLAPPTDAQESAAPGDIRNEKKGTTKMNTKEGSTPRNHSPITHTPSASCNPPLTTAISPCNYPPQHPLSTLSAPPHPRQAKAATTHRWRPF